MFYFKTKDFVNKIYPIRINSFIRITEKHQSCFTFDFFPNVFCVVNKIFSILFCVDIILNEMYEFTFVSISSCFRDLGQLLANPVHH